MLRAHIIVKLSDQHTFQCALCNFSATAAFALSNHMNRSHLANLNPQEERTGFTCLTCGHATVTMEQMKEHNEDAHLKPVTNDSSDGDNILTHPMIDSPLFDHYPNTEDIDEDSPPPDFQDSTSDLKDQNIDILCEFMKYPICEMNSESSKDLSNELNIEDTKYPICELNSECSKDLSNVLNSEDTNYPICELNSERVKYLSSNMGVELVKEDTVKVKEEIVSQE